MAVLIMTGCKPIIILIIMCLMLNRPLILEYGLWDEIRVDQGKEWVLSLFVQEQMAHLRTNTARPPHLQSTSKKVCVVYIITLLASQTVTFTLG